jgi:hypothetical protein
MLTDDTSKYGTSYVQLQWFNDLQTRSYMIIYDMHHAYYDVARKHHPWLVRSSYAMSDI